MPTGASPSPQKVRAVLIKAGFTPSRTWRTSVPGWHNWSEGFKVERRNGSICIRHVENSARRGEIDSSKTAAKLAAYAKALADFNPTTADASNTVYGAHVHVVQTEAGPPPQPKGKTLIEVFAAEDAKAAVAPAITDLLPNKWQFKPFMNDCGVACTPNGCPGHASSTVIDTLGAGPLTLTLNTDDLSSTEEWRAAEVLTEVLLFIRDEFCRNVDLRNRLLRRLHG